MIGRAGLAALVVGAAFLGPAAEDIAAQEPQDSQPTSMEGLTGSTVGPLADSALEARASRLASELRCPVCQGLSIQDSPSPLAQEMKGLIRSQVVEGRSDDEIRQYFISKYGEWILLEPRAVGLNLLVYVMPALALVAGAGLIAVAVRRWTVPPEDDTAPPA